MFLLEWPGGSWEASLRIVATILAIYVVVLWATLVFWVYRDIRQRTRDPIIQTVAVLLVLIFFLPGHWVYLILRPRYTLTELYERSLEEEALLQELEDQKACPSCNRRTQEDFLVCPFCRATLKEPCRSCSKPLARAWVSCPYCGMEKPAPPRVMPPRPAHAIPAPTLETRTRTRSRSNKPAPRNEGSRNATAPSRPTRDPFGSRRSDSNGSDSRPASVSTDGDSAIIDGSGAGHD